MIKFLILLVMFFTQVNASPKVAVIGGGLAGLTSAYRLKQMGYNVDVYEARQRLGGRVFTVMVNGRPAELGGQNILDGGKAENMLALISELGLECESGRRPFHRCIYLDGENSVKYYNLLRSYQFTPENVEHRLQYACKNAENLKEVLIALFPNDGAIVRILSLRLAVYEGLEPQFLSLANLPTLQHMLLGGLSASHPGEGKEETYVEFLSVKGGNSVLIEKLAEKLSDNIHCGLPLTTISRNQSSRYILTFESGKQVEADIVILTIPCTVYEDISIDPSIIPTEKLQAIKKVRYGTNSKIICPIVAPYPPETYCNDYVLTYYPGYISDFMTMYYVGEYGRFDASSIQSVFQRDKRFLNKFYHLSSDMPLPVAAADKARGSYTGPVGHSWIADPYVKGSYSVLAVGQKLGHLETRNGETVKALFAPIHDSLFFAGEHASILLDVGGTMEAAVESGERAARMIQNHY